MSIIFLLIVLYLLVGMGVHLRQRYTSQLPDRNQGVIDDLLHEKYQAAREQAKLNAADKWGGDWQNRQQYVSQWDTFMELFPQVSAAELKAHKPAKPKFDAYAVLFWPTVLPSRAAEEAGAKKAEKIVAEDDTYKSLLEDFDKIASGSNRLELEAGPSQEPEYDVPDWRKGYDYGTVNVARGAKVPVSGRNIGR